MEREPESHPEKRVGQVHDGHEFHESGVDGVRGNLKIPEIFGCTYGVTTLKGGDTKVHLAVEGPLKCGTYTVIAKCHTPVRPPL